MAVICYCLLRISLSRDFSLYKTAAALIAVFNPASFYLLLEFTKNSFALALFFVSFVLLNSRMNLYWAHPAARGRTGLSVSIPRPLAGPAGFPLLSLALAYARRSLPPPGGRTFWGLLFGLGAVFSHRIILALLGFLFLHRLAAGLRAKGFRIRGPGKIIIAGGGLVLLILGLILWREFFASRMPALDMEAPLRRLAQFSGPRLLPGERIFYTLLQLSLFFLIPWPLIRRPFSPAAPLGFLAWIFVFPFLSFSWDGTSFRLLIMAPLFAAPWLMEQNLKALARPAGIVLIAGSILFSAASVRDLAHSKGPRYSLLRRDLGGLETLAAGRRVIAHRGLAGFLWYEMGIRSENFIPPAEEGPYLRLVYFFAPETLEPYVRDGEPRPVALNRSYTLVEEYIWQRFYRDRQDIQFLKSELNPFLPRPASGFSINEETALLMTGTL
jgi:hypothetical protein